MAKPVLGYGDLISGATTIVTASSEQTTQPAINLKYPHLTKPWRTVSGVTSCSILADFCDTVSIGWTALAGMNLSTTGSARVRFSTVDATGAAGDAYDSGSVVGQTSPAYDLFAHLLPSSPSGRYLRIDLSDATVTTGLKAGRWWGGPIMQSTRSSYNYGAKRLYRDLGERSFSETGQAWVVERGKQRGFSLEFPSLTQDDYEDHLLTFHRIHGLSDDVMVMRDPGAGFIPRETIIGTIENVVEIQMVGFKRYSLQLTVYERL